MRILVCAGYFKGTIHKRLLRLLNVVTTRFKCNTEVRITRKIRCIITFFLSDQIFHVVNEISGGTSKGSFRKK